MTRITIFAISLMLFTLLACDKASTCIDESKIKEDCICTEEYAPVCGCNSQTYSNACHAICSGVESFKQGECPSKKK